MNNNATFTKKIMPLFVVFIAINCLVIGFKLQLLQINIKADVVVGANCILFLLSSACIAIHKNALDKKNSRAFVNSMMLVSLLKLMVVATSVIVYVLVTKEKRNVYGVFCGMGLYIIYSVIEVKIATKMKKENGN